MHGPSSRARNRASLRETCHPALCTGGDEAFLIGPKPQPEIRAATREQLVQNLGVTRDCCLPVAPFDCRARSDKRRYCLDQPLMGLHASGDLSDDLPGLDFAFLGQADAQRASNGSGQLIA